MKTGRSAWCAALLTLGLIAGLFATPLFAQALKNPNIEGVLFFKEHSFTDPSQGTWPIEYRSAASNGQIILITTREGRRVRGLLGQVPDLIPYPGRGGVTKKEAIVLCDIALLKYPQHRALLMNVRNAWRRADSQDYVIYGPASEARQLVMDTVIDNMASESARIQAQKAVTAQPSSVSLLDKQPEAAPSEDGGSDDHEQTLRELQDYYKQLQELVGR